MNAVKYSVETNERGENPYSRRKSVSLQPTVILNVEPDRVKYGLTSTRGDHWEKPGTVLKLLQCLAAT